MAPRVAGRVGEIVEAAEAAAAALTCEAQQRAERRLREAEAEAERRLDTARRQADELEAAHRRRTAMARSLGDSARAVLGKLEEVATVRADLEQLLHELEPEFPRFADEHGAGEAAEERSADGAREERPARRFALPRHHARRVAWVEGDLPPEHPDLAGIEDRGKHSRWREDPGASRTRLPGPGPEEARRFVGAATSAPAAAEAGHPPYDGDEDAAARVVAVHMAAAGSSRGEVALHLDRTFPLADPGAILDGVFGAANSSIRPRERRVAG